LERPGGICYRRLAATEDFTVVTMTNCRRRLGPGVEFHCDSFDAAQSSHVALVGPSGCGKSTMLNLIAGLLRPDSGEIMVDGKAVHSMSGAQLDRFRGERLGFVFQTFNLLRPFTAMQNVLLGMRFSDTVPHKEWKPRAHHLLERVGLGHRMHARPGTMSVGEQQRVAIARALANDPKILIADEPTGSLDPKSSASVMELLLDLVCERQLTLLLVTHDVAIAQNVPRQYDCTHLVREVATA
jgi:ABC-type lipoprotein export system ATPase subunit